MAGETRKADAIVAASKPRMVCSISGARMAGSIAGWAQANIRPRRSSGIAASSIGLVQLLGEQAQVIDRVAARAPTARGIDQPAPRDRHQPRLRAARDAGGGPVGERGGERVGQRVLGRGHVAGARREEGDQLAVAAARHGLGRLRRSSVSRGIYMTQIGRTSIAPTLAPGQRAAQDSAASRSGTSIR